MLFPDNMIREVIDEVASDLHHLCYQPETPLHVPRDRAEEAMRAVLTRLLRTELELPADP